MNLFGGDFLAFSTTTCKRPKVFSIPSLGYETIDKLAKRIRPVCRRTLVVGHTEFWYCLIDDPWNTALTASLLAIEKAADNICPFITIATYHEPVVENDERAFMPSAAEVLAQIPIEYLSKITGYEVARRNIDIATLSERDREALKAGYFLANVTLYAKK